MEVWMYKMMYVCMNGWMDEWNGCMDVWNGWMK